MTVLVSKDTRRATLIKIKKGKGEKRKKGRRKGRKKGEKRRKKEERKGRKKEKKKEKKGGGERRRLLVEFHLISPRWGLGGLKNLTVA